MDDEDNPRVVHWHRHQKAYHPTSSDLRRHPTSACAICEFPKFPETCAADGAEARPIKGLAIDPVRFGKIWSLEAAAFGNEQSSCAIREAILTFPFYFPF